MKTFKLSKRFMNSLRVSRMLGAGEWYTLRMYEEAFEDIKETIEEEIANNQAELDKLNGETETK